MKYRVTQNSFIGSRLVRAGEIVELPDGTKADHLVPLDKPAEPRRTIEALNKVPEPMPTIIPAATKPKVAKPVIAPGAAEQYTDKKKS